MDFFEEATKFASNPVSYISNAVTGGAYDPFSDFLGDKIGGSLSGLMGKPDYDPALKAQQAAFDEEKKRRAMEANRTDLQASQAARLFFGSSTTNPKSDMTNDFLGL